MWFHNTWPEGYTPTRVFKHHFRQYPCMLLTKNSKFPLSSRSHSQETVHSGKFSFSPVAWHKNEGLSFLEEQPCIAGNPLYEREHLWPSHSSTPLPPLHIRHTWSPASSQPWNQLDSDSNMDTEKDKDYVPRFDACSHPVVRHTFPIFHEAKTFGVQMTCWCPQDSPLLHLFSAV